MRKKDLKELIMGYESFENYWDIIHDIEIPAEAKCELLRKRRDKN